MEADKVQKTEDNILEKPFFTWLFTILILFSVVCFSIDTFPDLHQNTRKFLYISEIIVVGIFSLEYIYRIIKAENKLKFIFSFYGIIDLLAILPFYLAFAIDLRSLRLLRLMRLIRVLKLVRYNSAIRRFYRALYMAKEELTIFMLASIVLLYLAAMGIYQFEHVAQPDTFTNIFDCLWWAVATLTTVGYGDLYPITVAGRFFTLCILMIGLGLIAVPTGIIASALSAIRTEEIEEEKQNRIQG